VGPRVSAIGGDGIGDGVWSGGVEAGTRDMHSVPEKRTTDIDKATGRIAEHGLG
jgi:hypothetical protein